MKPFVFSSLLFAVVLWSGCGTVNHTQYQVTTPARGEGTRATVSGQDREMVKQIVQAVGTHLRLKDFTAHSLVPNVIVAYQESDSAHPLKLLAWTEQDKIVIDLLQSPSSVGETRSYREAKSILLSALKRYFGERAATVDFRHTNRAPATGPH